MSTEITQKLTKWKTFYPASKAFKVKFPIHPKYEKTELPIDGTNLSTHYEGYESIDSQGAIYSVSCITYPSEIAINKIEPEKFVEDIVQSSSSNKLISSQNTQVGKYNAIDYLVQSRVGYMKGRIVLVGQIKYLLMVSYQEESYKEEDYRRFIDSFSLESIL